MHSIARRRFLAVAAGCVMTGRCVRGEAAAPRSGRRTNFLLVTADDMNWDTPGCFGGHTAGLTPNIDRLAAEGVSFRKAHVTCAVCMPSRETLMTGRYPHRSGGMGFEPIRADVPTLQERLHDAGYLNGILGKVEHLAPAAKFPWDFVRDFYDLGCGRDQGRYYQATKAFIEQADNAGQPFYLMANSHDPHRPFHASVQEKDVCDADWSKHGARREDIPAPSRVYEEGEVHVPGFLPDIPKVRREITEYTNSARRCDDTVGAVLRALTESGHDRDTVVMFLSDNGMSFPYAKTNCYLNSTRTPWIVRWPGITKPASADNAHFVSGIDYMPTILEIAGVEAPEGMDGRSFVPLLAGRAQDGRDRVFTQFHRTSANINYPMRCVQDARFGYIYNAWADGRTKFKNEPQSGLTMKAMEEAAQTVPAIAQRVDFFIHRTPEELYDFEKDPDALVNIANAPDAEAVLRRLRTELAQWMTKTQDPLTNTYASFLRGKPAAR